MVPITLTEALGCDRCQNIFVVTEDGQGIEQLPTNSPYKRCWNWNGNQWCVTNTRLRESYLPMSLVIVIGLVVFWLPYALGLPLGPSVIPWVILAVLLATLPALMVWLAYRR
nr:MULTISPECIES: hypothetical protein [unclassified Laspinema]